MVSFPNDYTLFQKFIETYSPTGFKAIDRSDKLIRELEKLTEANNQYFFIADLLQAKIIFTSNRSTQILGIDPEEHTPYHLIEACHPSDVHRNTNGWAKLLQMGNDLFLRKDGFSMLSTNMRIRNPKGTYSEILFQCYLFYSGAPNNTIYELQIHTNIDSFKLRKNGCHYYAGNDISYFRYPDQHLLNIGNCISNREFEILRLIATSHSSEQIAEKLFLSINTVNTHRRNILVKTSKSTISEVIHEFKERGVL
jgi:DNA-binding CsgD family transcriptional regulator